MYPSQELIRLANHKLALRRRIMIHRAQCVEAAVVLARPLAWVDRLRSVWQNLAPLTRIAALPLALLVKRKVFPKVGILGSLLRWGPLVFGAVRGIGSVVQGRRSSLRNGDDA